MAHPVVQATATSTTGSNSTTHTITVPSGVVSGDLLIAFIAIENATSPANQFTGVTDSFTEIKDKTTGGTAGASLGVFFKVSDGTEGATSIRIVQPIACIESVVSTQRLILR